MTYKPAPVPANLSRVVAQYLREELRRIEIELQQHDDKSPGIFQATGSTNITNAAATLGIETAVADPGDNYTLASSVVTVGRAGWYHADLNCPVDDEGSAGAARGRVFIWLERDQGTSTWIAVENIRGQDYARELSAGQGVNAAGLVELDAGESVRMRIQQSTSVDIQSESAQASLNIYRISG